MAHLGILQLAAPGRPLRDKIEQRARSLAGDPARLAREVGLALGRARATVTNAVGLVDGPLDDRTAAERRDQCVSLEAGRALTPVAHDDGVVVYTVLATGPRPPFAAVSPGDVQALERTLQALAATADGTLSAFVVHVAPADGEALDPSTLAATHPHLAAIAPGKASGWTRCRFCDAPMEAYRTSCPACGGAVAS